MAWSLLPSLDPRERMRTLRDEVVLTLVIAAIMELRTRSGEGGGGGLYVGADGTITELTAVSAADYAAMTDPDPLTLFVIV